MPAPPVTPRKVSVVKRKFANLLIIVFALGSAQVLAAQTRARNTAAPAPSGLLTRLPESDAVAQVKLRQLLNESLPRIFANNSAKLAEINTSIESFKTRTGLDPRMFETIALGARFSYPGEGVTKVQTVALANGSFSPAAMVAAGRIATSGNYREEKYQGKTIYIFKLDQDIRLLGFFDFPGHDHPEFHETIGALQHMAISVSSDQFERAKAKLIEAGIEYLGPDRGADDSLYFRDPNGLGLELYNETLGVFEGTPLL